MEMYPCDKFQKFKLWKTKYFKLWQNSTTQVVTKLKNNNSNQKNKFWQKSFVKNNWTSQQPMKCIRNSHLQFCNVFNDKVVKPFGWGSVINEATPSRNVVACRLHPTGLHLWCGDHQTFLNTKITWESLV